MDGDTTTLRDARSLVNEVLGPRVVDPEAEIAAVIERFNALYFVLNEAGKAVILQPGFDPVLKRRHYDRMSPRDLMTLYMNEMIQVGFDEKERPVYKSAAAVWLHNRKRRQFIHGVTFDPTNTSEKEGVLNLWEGFAVKPEPGDWSLMKGHIEAIICAGDPIRINYMMSWLARMFQRPAEQGEVAVVMKGGEGSGKGTIANAVRTIIGQHSMKISNPKHLVGNFNAHLRDCVFLFADEAFFAGDRGHVGVLKSIITESSLTVEAKYANAVEAPNYLHVMMASNEEWVVPAAIDARRFFVLEVDGANANNHGYFGEIWAQMEAGGYAAMLHDLLTLDIKDFNVRAVPTTEGLQRQRKLSLPTTEAWWLDCLERGYVFRSRLGLEAEFAVWLPKISTELLFASYTEFAKAHNERRILSRESLGRFFASLNAAASRWRGGIVGEHVVDVANMHGGTNRTPTPVIQDRVHGYTFGALDQARGTFVEVTGIPVLWDGGVGDEEG